MVLAEPVNWGLERLYFNLCLKYGVPLLIDGAQGAGAINIDLAKFPAISFFTASAHKSLLGPLGLGILYVQQGQGLDPSLCGGTGSRSDSLEMPRFLPDRLEPGTPAVQLIAGLAAAVGYLEKHHAAIGEQEEKLSNYFIEQIREIKGVQLHGRRGESGGTADYLPTFALSFANAGADQMADK